MRVGKTKQFLLLGALFALLYSVLPSSAAADKNEEWILVQHKEGSEDHVFISHDAVKIVSTIHQLHLIAKAPDWTVHAFQPSDKVEWTGPLKSYSAMMAVPMHDDSRDAKHVLLKPDGTCQTNGMKCSRYRYGKSEIMAGMLAASDTISIAPQGAELLARYFLLPDCGKVALLTQRQARGAVSSKVLDDKKAGVPWIDYAITDQRKGLVTQFHTSSIKRVPFNASDFALPKNYKQVSDFKTVAYSKKDKQNVEWLIDNTGFASDKP